MAPSTLFQTPRDQIPQALPSSSSSSLSTQSNLKIPLSSSSSEHENVHSALAEARARFAARNPKSRASHEKALESLPGGNTRTLLYTAPFPISMRSGREWRLEDDDGHFYTDFVAEMTAGLYGHSNPIIKETITSVLSDIGLNLGATTSAESTYAAALCSRFALDRIRFCNSGTEANLHALAGARKFTGRRKVVVFSGGYHGAVLSFAGGTSAENNVDRDDWIIARYNDLHSAREAIASEGVAAVLVEGLQGAGGALPGTPEFLKGVESAAREAGVLFILDEVMTSRFGAGGLARLEGLQPDMKTFGKYLGGGMAFGAFGGRQEVMAVFDPRTSNALSHSGTFNNNTLVMACGHAGLSKVYTPGVAVEFGVLGEWLLTELNRVCEGTKISWTGRATILCAHTTADGRTSIARAEDACEDWDLKDLFWMEMLEAGYWISRRGSIALILGTPREELERFVQAVAAFLEKYSKLVHVERG